MIHVVVGLVFNALGEVLIAQRPPHKYCPSLWEFPGGKVEQNEKALAALKREFHEEIGIEIIAANFWFELSHEYPDRVVLLEIWRIKHFTGEAHGAEGQEIRWVAIQDLAQFQFPDGNKLILEKLLEC